MPHWQLAADELETAYPSLEAPDELPLEDLSRLEDDAFYQAGMPVVQQIIDEMAAAGRTRRQGQASTLSALFAFSIS